MQVLRVTGGARLSGEVAVVGAKNSVLKLLAAALMAPGETTIRNLPAISDVMTMHELLGRLGCEVSTSSDGNVDSVRTTVLDNAAREPEIVDLCRMLQAMGAQIDGIGSSTLAITGVDALRPVTHVAVADRIVAGTWAFAAAATLGDIDVRGANAAHLEISLDKLTRAGADIEV